MGDDETIEEAPAPASRRSRASNTLRWIGRGVFVLLLLFGLVIAWLHTGWGRQFIVNEITKFSPSSGLSVEVGSIEGSVLWSATFHDVKLRDADGKLFLEVPEVDLNWRPYKFPFTGLDVRHLVLHEGTLYASPNLVPGDPDAPTLPDFDIRVDQFVLDDLHVDKSLLGEARTVNFHASANIRKGLVDLKGDGDLGGGDEFRALVLAEPDGDRFDLDLDYRAPKGGLLANLVGAEEDTRLRLDGKGTWQKWNGKFLARQGGNDLAAFDIVNRAGVYAIDGEVRPGEYVSGPTAKALGETVSLSAKGTLANSVLKGEIALRGAGVQADADGAVDLANNAFDGVTLNAALLDPALFGESLKLDDARLQATLDGPFRDLSVRHQLIVGRLDAGGTILVGLTQQGTLGVRGERIILPLDATVKRVVSGVDTIDPRLVNGRLSGMIALEGNQLTGERLALNFPGLQANGSLRGNLATGAYEFAGPVRADGFALQDLGTLDARANIKLRLGGPSAWALTADFNGRMRRVTNETVANLAGDNIRFDGALALGDKQAIALRRTTLRASKLSLTIDATLRDGRTTLAGKGRHVDYGPFTVEAAMEKDGPHAVLVFAEPLPAAGLRDVRVELTPSGNGFEIKTEGQSVLGGFDGLVHFVSPEGGPSVITFDQFNVADTSLTGEIALADGGADGTLDLAGGGLDGTITLKPRDGGQGFDVALDAKNAQFRGQTSLAIGQARINASGVLAEGGVTLDADVHAAGVSYGSLFLGRLTARAQVRDGTGTFDAALSGSRGSQFDLKLTGKATPERIAVAAKGSYAGQPISMPRYAVLTKTEDGGWELQQSQLSFGGGAVVAEGRIGGDEPMHGKISIDGMPLSLVDIYAGDLGLGGTISGVVEVDSKSGGVPTGDARIKIKGLTRSGLVLSSRPIDVSLVARLSQSDLQARAVIKDGGSSMGRLQARISNLPASGALPQRLAAGDLLAQLRFNGPADALWRLSRLELIDLTGPVQVAADVTGSLGNPQIRGSLAGDSLRLQSALTGTDMRELRARGRFSGSRLQLTSFAGKAPNGGTVSGSGFVDLSNMGAERGPQIDLRLAARNAEIVDLPTMGATVTGPLRIVSNGIGGTIAGRVDVREARWKLGGSDAAQELPDIATREINAPPDRAPPRARGAPWRFLIDARARGGIAVTGMGLDSEWGGTVRLRGTTEDPRIGGQVEVVPRQGFYSFAGVRFDLTRGRIDFDENAPIDPRIDILAETDVEALSVSVAVTGSASQPEITFSSTPALPEEEILARLLFGGSISDLSATDALQLGAAVASLRGGGGMDPINKLRSAVGLDRLRIVPADPALDRGTAVALGKNFGRRFYAEVITDGRSYNASSVEFRVTSWLSLLGTVSSIGRNSVAAEYRKDY